MPATDRTPHLMLKMLMVPLRSLHQHCWGVGCPWPRLRNIILMQVIKQQAPAAGICIQRPDPGVQP